MTHNSKYNLSLFDYQRIKTREVAVGKVLLGESHPIRIQSMTTTDTTDTENSVKQAQRLVEVGCEIIRFTAPNKVHAAKLQDIKDGLMKQGIDVPLVADIHFTPSAAEVAANIVEKIRVNPGNYADKKKFESIDYTDDSYEKELVRIREKFTPLVLQCKANHVAMRIGTNHGSLSDRILSRYGDTPLGMVESALEFIQICEDNNYLDLVISMKASNPKVMIQAYRLLMSKMLERKHVYPLHLGVTEAGEGEDGRIKSAVGIGTLLEDGLGDTIRVSLTEEPEAEIPIAKILAGRYLNRKGDPIPTIKPPINPFEYNKRKTHQVKNIGDHSLPVVLADFSKKDTIRPATMYAVGYNYSIKLDKWIIGDASCDYLYLGKKSIDFNLPGTLSIIQDYSVWKDETTYPFFTKDEFVNSPKTHSVLNFVILKITDLTSSFLDTLRNDKSIVIILQSNNANQMAEMRAVFFKLINEEITTPVIIHGDYPQLNSEDLMLYSSTDIGGLYIDGFGDGIFITADKTSPKEKNDIAFGILQATRTRISKTDYISCPSCGRTLFDLQETTAKIRNKTSHLKGLKIGIMGCIVNGPGEMADADYGYVGTGIGKINLYKEKTVVKKNVPEDKAVEELVELIKEYGDWIDPKKVDV